ncbi:hypothetical protein [Pseudomonas fulva]|nr:hypothetical protein [Pseudomonas fulva]
MAVSAVADTLVLPIPVTSSTDMERARTASGT